MALIGSTVDPRMFVQDYSGFANAAAIQAAGMMNFGNQIGSAIADYGKQQKQAKDALKAGEAQIKAAAVMFPSQAPMLEGLANELRNEDTPISQRAAIASQISELISMGVGEKRYQQDMQFRQSAETRENMAFQQDYGRTADAIAAEKKNTAIDQKTKTTIAPALFDQVLKMAESTSPAMAADIRKNAADASPEEKFSIANSIMGLLPKSERAKAPTVQDIPMGDGGSLKMQWDENSGQWVPLQTAITNPGLTQFVSSLEGFIPKAYSDSGQTSIGYGTKAKPGEKEITQEEAAARLQSELATHAANVDNAIKKSGQQFTQNERDALVSFDFNTGAGASVISRFASDKKALAAKMAEYNKLDKKDKSPSQGLINRRNAELQLFATPSAPMGYTPPQSSQVSPKDAQAMEIAAQEQAAKVETAQTEKASAQAAKARALATIDKYMTPDGKPTAALSDAVGYGEGVASWVRGVTGIPLNQAGTVANQKQLQLDLIEQSILEASKALKPVSNDEMKMLKANRPEITDPPEVWTQYMKRIKAILGNPDNYKTDPAQARVSDTSALRAKLGR